MQVSRIFSIQDSTDACIDDLANATHRTRSAIVDLAVAQLTKQEEFSQIQVKPTTRKTRRVNINKIPGVRKGAAIQSEAA